MLALEANIFFFWSKSAAQRNKNTVPISTRTSLKCTSESSVYPLSTSPENICPAFHGYSMMAEVDNLIPLLFDLVIFLSLDGKIIFYQLQCSFSSSLDLLPLPKVMSLANLLVIKLT